MQQHASNEEPQAKARSIIFVCTENVLLRRRIHLARIGTSQFPFSFAAFEEAELLNYCREVITKACSRAVHIDIVLNAASDFPMIRRIWECLERDIVSSITLRICLYSSDIATIALNQLILDLDDHQPLSLQNKFEVLAKRGLSAASVMMTRRAPYSWPRQVVVAFLTTNPQVVLFNALRELKIERNTQVVFLRKDLPNLHERVARDFWKQVFASEIPEVICCDDAMCCTPLRLFDKAPPTTLFVFPERMLPLQRAYYLRAFDMLIGLNYGGEASGVLVFGPNNADLARIQRALEIVSPCVFTYPLNRGGYPLHHHMTRKTETFLRRRIGVQTSPPIRFSERCYTFGTKHHSQRLSESIGHLPSLRNVVYTGAWFTPSVQPLMKSAPSLRWYCDTHDVFFIVDRDSNQHERRFIYSPKRHKQREIELMNQANGIIAISEADRLSLQAAGCMTEVIVESGSFSHAARGVDVQHGPTAPIFGFIGSNNKNNEKCLQMVLASWWPVIAARNVQAKLLIAGGICKSSVAESLAREFPDSVQRLGFVDLVSDFYSSVQAMLSPIAIQGGLNFKSVEALMAGRPLLTNELGSRCIGSGLEGVCIIGANGEGVAEVMERLGDSQNQAQWRESIHQQASSRFSDNVAYRQLIEKLQGDYN